MHPILQQRLRLVLYLAAWTPALALLAYAGRADASTSWLQAAALFLPAFALFAFACLPPWHISRTRPLRFSEWSGLLGTWTVASLAAGALLAGIAHGTTALANKPSPNLTLLTAMGAVLYLLSA